MTPPADRWIALPAALCARLKARQLASEGELVFPAPRRPDALWDVRNCRRVLQAILDGAGFDWAVPHTLRTTAATRLLDAGIPARKVADLLGHASVTTTLGSYAGRSRDADASVAEALGALPEVGQVIPLQSAR